MDEQRRAYFAGFFDGEGCISLVRGGPTIAVAVVQVDRSPLDLLSSVYGGRVAPHGKPAKEGHRQAYRWQVYGSRARMFLGDVRPWLIVKAEKADEALAMHDPRPYTTRQMLDYYGRSQDLSDLSDIG